MKKLLSVILVALVISVSLSSCKSHERCPAYGKVEQNSKKSI